MFKSVKLLLATMLLTLGLASCSLLGQVEDKNLVLTTQNQVQPTEWGNVDIISTELIPAEFKEAWKDEIVVVAHKEQLIPDAKSVPISLKSERWDWNSILDLISGAATVGATWFPPLALLEGILTMIFPRKRQNYANMVKSLSKADIKEALANAVKGLGWVHSSEKTAEVFKAELDMKKTGG